MGDLTNILGISGARRDLGWTSGGKKRGETKWACRSKKVEKAGSTRVSRAVPHLSTNRALSRLTSEFGWDPVRMA